MSDRDEIERLARINSENCRRILERDDEISALRSRLTQLRDEMRHVVSPLLRSLVVGESRQYSAAEAQIVRWADTLDQILSGGPQGR